MAATSVPSHSTRVVASGTDPKWSRDGRLILFKTWDDASQQLWISTVTAEGTNLRKLAPGVHPSWSPDNTQIAFMRDRADGGADIWLIGLDGKGTRASRARHHLGTSFSRGSQRAGCYCPDWMTRDSVLTTWIPAGWGEGSSLDATARRPTIAANWLYSRPANQETHHKPPPSTLRATRSSDRSA